MLRSVAALVVLAETVAGFQSPCLPGLRSPAVPRRAALRAAPRMGMGFDDGAKDKDRGPASGPAGAPGAMPPGMPPGMQKLFSDPEILAAMQNPKLVKVGQRAGRTRLCVSLHATSLRVLV